jgi:hypothetical protein
MAHGPFDRVPTAFLPVIQLRTRMRTDTRAATRSTTSRTKLCPAKSSYCALPTTCRWRWCLTASRISATGGPWS